MKDFSTGSCGEDKFHGNDGLNLCLKVSLGSKKKGKKIKMEVPILSGPPSLLA